MPQTERFFRSLKSERLSHFRFVSRQSAEMQILDYISYYNIIPCDCIRPWGTSPLLHMKKNIAARRLNKKVSVFT